MSGAIEELRRVEEAVVRKAGRRAGRLTRTPEGCEFAYDSDYEGPAVATTLPLGAAPVRTSAGAVPPFFAGLLPEGRRLAAVRAAVKTSADDDFSLLLATAHEAIGDVQVLAVGWDQEAADWGVGVGLDTDRVALPGVQDKVSSAMISLPVHFRGGPRGPDAGHGSPSGLCPRPAPPARLRLPELQRRRPRQELLGPPGPGRRVGGHPRLRMCPAPTSTGTTAWRFPSTARVDAVPLWLARLDELPFDARRLHKLRRAVEFRRERLGA